MNFLSINFESFFVTIFVRILKCIELHPSGARVRPDGKRCVQKVSSVETLEKDPILECNHKDVEKCHYTYVTEFEANKEELCNENFEKKCQITFKKEAVQEKVKKCYRPQESSA